MSEKKCNVMRRYFRKSANFPARVGYRKFIPIRVSYRNYPVTNPYRKFIPVTNPYRKFIPVRVGVFRDHKFQSIHSFVICLLAFITSKMSTSTSVYSEFKHLSVQLYNPKRPKYYLGGVLYDPKCPRYTMGPTVYPYDPKVEGFNVNFKNYWALHAASKEVYVLSYDLLYIQLFVIAPTELETVVYE